MIRLRPELRVLFVCSANICRSPLAEALLRHRLREAGLARRVRVRSAGIRAVGGQRPDPRVVRMAAEAGVSFGRIRSRALTPQMLLRSDHVLLMEQKQLEAVDQQLVALSGREGGGRNRLQLLGSFIGPQDGAGQRVADILDPYFGDMRNLSVVYEQIDSAIDGLIPWIRSQLGAYS